MFWRPWTPQGPPNFVGPLRDSLGSPNWRKTEKKCSEKHVEKHAAHSAAQEVSQDPRLTFTLKLLSNLNNGFSVSTCTSKTIKKSVQWVPLGDPFGWFWRLLGTILSDKMSIENSSKKWYARAAEAAANGVQSPSRIDHGQALKDGRAREALHFVPWGHGGGYIYICIYVYMYICNWRTLVFSSTNCLAVFCVGIRY